MLSRLINFFDRKSGYLRFKALGCVYYGQLLCCSQKSRKSSGNNKVPVRNILHINYSDCQGGAARIAYELFRYQRSKGFGSKMLVSNKKSSDAHIETLVPDNSKIQHRLAIAQDKLQ